MSKLSKLLPFGVFILLFKFGAGLHFTLLAPLGARVFDVWVVGLLIGGAALLQLLHDVPAGFALDRFGYLRLLWVTTAAFIVATSVLIAGLTPMTFIATLFLGAFGWLFYGPGIDAYLLSMTPVEYAGRIVSIRDILASVGIVFSTALLAFMLSIPVPIIGGTIAIILLCALLAGVMSPRDRVSVHAEKKVPTHHYHVRRHHVGHIFHAIWKLNPASGLLLLSGLAGSIFYAVIWFVVPLLLDSPSGTSLPSVALGVFDFAVAVLGFFFGRLADKWNQKWLIFFGLLLFSVTGALLGFSTHLWFLVLGFMATAGDELSGLALWAWMDRLDKSHREDGLIAGVISFFQDLGWTIGPLVAGFLYGAIGPAWTIAVGAIPILITWMISFWTLAPLAVAPYEPAIRPPHRRKHKS
ncbi:MAG: MFS transporter [Candidatus Yonathbacteria bacterium]|nr:MFS transporter [Candidatus Yonathbacteria bacterium]